ncbi:unnamed protein product [Symbiodinium pilosum]|uniref:Cytochrome b561 domain-containing protein n=1 Tax=Symbiodinium pilosum TaxID=2952 RepID=A0A812NXB1_SYMPI|nr:unnamed protein product [Symbiodinium pilosum]
MALLRRRRSWHGAAFIAAVSMAACCQLSSGRLAGFAGPGRARSQHREVSQQKLSRAAGGLEFLREPLEAYAAARVADSPFLAEAPEAALHWGHAAAMASVYPQLAFAAFLGWQIRFGKGEDTTPLSLGIASKTLHPVLSLAAFAFFLIGGQGGLVLLTAQKQTILESAHAITALLGLGFLALQAILPLTFQSGAQVRAAHAYLGSAIVLLMIVHAGFGISLGLSF